MKKIIKIILIVVASVVLLGTIFGIVDYNRAKNGKKPIFVYRNVNKYIEGNLIVTEYYGLGYSIVICDFCMDSPIIRPLYLGGYAWFIGSDYITDVEVTVTKKCDNKTKLYYTEEDKNIYTYCLDKIYVSLGKKTNELKDYLKIDSNAIDFIINEFTENPSSYDDGGSILYYGTNFNVLKCHTLGGNKDIYIGTKNMGYFNGFCQ